MSGLEQRSISGDRYPAGAVDEAIIALELSRSYLLDKPVVLATIDEALRRMYRARELFVESGRLAASGRGAS